MRALVKDVAAQGASWSGFARFRRRVHREMPFIAAYHRVVERVNQHRALPAMEVSASTLEKHIDWIGKRFEIVSLDDLPLRARRSKPLAAITFDDGYSDVFHYGFPLLKRKGVPAGIFAVTDLIGTTQLPLHEQLYLLLSEKTDEADPFGRTQALLRANSTEGIREVIDRLSRSGRGVPLNAALQPMTWEMLAQMRDAGMTIGSHSQTHPFLTNETAARAANEATASRAALRQNLGIDATCFAYPGGDFNSAVVDAVHAAGYRLGFTICRHRDARHPMLTIPRCGLWERACLDRFGDFSAPILSCHAAGVLGRSYCPNQH